MRAPRPDCPHCHGGGDREVVIRKVTGTGDNIRSEVAAYHYEPCPCRYTRPEPDEAEENA